MMTMKKIAGIIISLIILKGYNSYGQQPADTVFSLQQCVDVALANNELIKQAELNTETDYITLKQARDNRLPLVGANLNQGINQGRSIDPFTNAYINQNVNYGNYSLSTDVNLFNGGLVNNSIRQNRFALESSRMTLQQLKENVTLNVILAYLQILDNEDLLQQSRNQYELTQKQVERLEVLNKEGSIIPAQLYEFRGQLANDQLSLVNTENALDAARLALCQLMNIPYKKIEVQKVPENNNPLFYETDPASIYQSALQKFPSIKSAEFFTQSGKAGIKVARAGFYPAISLGGDLYTNYSSAATKDIFLNSSEVPSGDFVNVGGTKVPVITNRSNFNSQKIKYFDQFSNNYSTSINLNVRIPILNYNRANNNVRLAKAQFKNAEFLERTAKTQLSQNIEQAYFNMTAAFKKYQTLQQQVKDFEEAFKIAEIRFNEGATNQVEYLIAKNNLDRSNINLIIARYDFIFRSKILDYYQGKLVL
jgi:outer membrane protein